jgi:WD40 repeat protein
LINLKPIHHIATTFDGKLFATAEFEKYVSIWNVDKGELQISFQTHLDFGGERLAISPDGQLCAAGAYHIHGISVYRTLDGSVLWSRRDLKKVNWLKFDPIQETLLAGFEDKPLHILDSKTGETIETCRGVRRKSISSYDSNVFLLGAGKLKLHNGSKTPISLKIPAHLILDVTFDQRAAYLTEAGGPLRAVDCLDGSLLWEHPPERDSHFLRIGYNELTGTLFGLMWRYLTGGPYTLVELDPQTGKPMNNLMMGTLIVAEFGGRGTRLITSDGCILKLCKQANQPLQPTTLRFASRSA